MEPQVWIAARNRHTGEWSEGGTYAVYPREHWERYAVEATCRDQARKRAQALRGKQRRLTDDQMRILAEMVDETLAMERAGDDTASLLIEMHAWEVKAARRLQDLGLIYLDPRTEREARLQPSGWNLHAFTSAGEAA